MGTVGRKEGRPRGDAISAPGLPGLSEEVVVQPWGRQRERTTHLLIPHWGTNNFYFPANYLATCELTFSHLSQHPVPHLKGKGHRLVGEVKVDHHADAVGAKGAHQHLLRPEALG